MKKKNLFKNKVQMITYIILTIICVILFIVIGTTSFEKKEVNFASKFSNLYNLVSEDNIYIFSDATDILNVINGRSGVILFGFPKNKWVNMYASILNSACKEVGIDKIFYYDFLKDRDESNATYETIVKKLEMYAPINDEGIQDIMAPAVLLVKEGKVVGYFDDVAIIKGNITPDIYYNENNKALIYQKFKTALLEYSNME